MKGNETTVSQIDVQALLPLGRPIEPNRPYSDREIVLELGWTYAEIERARKSGLKFKELSRGHFVSLGSWLLAWLEGEDAPA